MYNDNAICLSGNVARLNNQLQASAAEGQIFAFLPKAALALLHGAPRPAYGRPRCAMLENSSTNTPLVTASHCWKERGVFAENSKIAEVVVHGGGSRGGSVASFTRTTSRYSSLQRQAPCAYPQSHAVGTDQCAIFRIVATVIDYLLITAWRLSSLERTSIVSYYSLERASIISIP